MTLKGSKLWDDYENTFVLRPDHVTIELYRYADSQSGENNPVPREKVEDDLYDITWEKEDEDAAWTYDIKGKNAQGELERYAPNGMPWRYVIRESLGEDSLYQVSRPAAKYTRSRVRQG